MKAVTARITDIQLAETAPAEITGMATAEAEHTAAGAIVTGAAEVIR
jgi:hypothetical protein